MDYTLYVGDCLDWMATMPDNTYNAVFCDPPYGISFMNKRWDHGVPSVAVWEQAYRVCKPGAVLMAFGGTRTWHRLAVNIEDAGWEMFDTIMYVYGSGFPKSHDISKAIDKAAGAERAVVGISSRCTGPSQKEGYRGTHTFRESSDNPGNLITAPATPEAAAWDGYGSALKPSYEPILCFRKPLESTYAHSALTYGTGAINVDGCRVDSNGTHASAARAGNGSGRQTANANGSAYGKGLGGVIAEPHPQGRFPANLIHDGSDDVLAVFDRAGVRPSGNNTPGKRGGTNPGMWSGKNPTVKFEHGDTGSAARFFYCAKSSASERSAGLEGMEKRVASVGNLEAAGRDATNIKNYRGGSQKRVESGLPPSDPRANHHPTVKPLALTEYLARLIVPPESYRDEAQLLIPFAGSGSEAIGAALAGWRNITGIELDPEYCEINRRRFAHWTQPQETSCQPALLEVR